MTRRRKRSRRAGPLRVVATGDRSPARRRRDTIAVVVRGPGVSGEALMVPQRRAERPWRGSLLRRRGARSRGLKGAPESLPRPGAAPSEPVGIELSRRIPASTSRGGTGGACGGLRRAAPSSRRRSSSDVGLPEVLDGGRRGRRHRSVGMGDRLAGGAGPPETPILAPPGCLNATSQAPFGGTERVAVEIRPSQQPADAPRVRQGRRLPRIRGRPCAPPRRLCRACLSELRTRSQRGARRECPDRSNVATAAPGVQGQAVALARSGPPQAQQEGSAMTR
jgi:hypothetical protein